MEKRLERLESKIDQLLDKHSESNETLARLTVSVETHEKRSTNLEAIVLPLKSERDMIVGGLKLIGLIATLAGIAAGVVKVIEFISKL